MVFNYADYLFGVVLAKGLIRIPHHHKPPLEPTNATRETD
jgi:hypothetical protein